ncbi:MAG: type II toxin-antitoxin system VapC family toxin [Proteobacteria bacterium]|nr:type II toxin-antitoxin system VapC family toxin [Pseudomonadota bacterium]
MPFVLDCSVALAWVLPDENSPEADVLAERLFLDTALVPPVWSLEVGNVLLVAVRRKRITREECLQFLSQLKALPIQIDVESTAQALGETLALAERFDLTTYDASYLELSKRRNFALATLDNKLRQACRAAGVAVLP